MLPGLELLGAAPTPVALVPGLEWLGYGFMQRALLAGLLVALASATLGVFLVLRGSAMVGDGLAHIAFGGVALGLVANLSPFLVALAFAVVAAVGIQAMRQRGIVLSDTAIAIFFTTGLATGVVLVSLGGGFDVDLFSFLFGSIVAVGPSDLPLVAAVSAVLLGTVALLHKELVYLTFSEEAAKVSGLPVGALNLVLSVLSALTIVIAARVVGVLLVSALLVVPAASALQVSRTFGRTLLTAMALGCLAVVAGLWLAFEADLAAGGSIAMVSVATFAAILVAKAAAGALRSARARRTAEGGAAAPEQA